MGWGCTSRGMHPGEGATKEEMFPDTGKPPQRQGWGSCPHLRGEHIGKCSNRGSKSKAENSQQRFLSNSASQPRSGSHSHAHPQGAGLVLRLRVQGLDLGERTGVGDSKDVLRGLVRHSRGSPGRSTRSFLRGHSNITH